MEQLSANRNSQSGYRLRVMSYETGGKELTEDRASSEESERRLLSGVDRLLLDRREIIGKGF
jgi:hypothetical protein